MDAVFHGFLSTQVNIFRTWVFCYCGERCLVLYSWNVWHERYVSHRVRDLVKLCVALMALRPSWGHGTKLSYTEKVAKNCQQKTSSFGTLTVHVPIILSHLREYVPHNVRYIWSFCRPALLVVDARSLGLRRKCCKKFYNILCLLIIFENGIDTFILSSNVIIDLINV